MNIGKKFQISVILGPEHGALELSKATESGAHLHSFSRTDINLSRIMTIEIRTQLAHGNSLTS